MDSDGAEKGVAVEWDGSERVWWAPGIHLRSGARGVAVQLDDRIAARLPYHGVPQWLGMANLLQRLVRPIWPPPLTMWQPVSDTLAQLLNSPNSLAPHHALPWSARMLPSADQMLAVREIAGDLSVPDLDEGEGGVCRILEAENFGFFVDVTWENAWDHDCRHLRPRATSATVTWDDRYTGEIALAAEGATFLGLTLIASRQINWLNFCLQVGSTGVWALHGGLDNSRP